jgi:hypothetical protein
MFSAFTAMARLLKRDCLQACLCIGWLRSLETNTPAILQPAPACPVTERVLQSFPIEICLSEVLYQLSDAYLSLRTVFRLSDMRSSGNR